jgi:hypothetical protein
LVGKPEVKRPMGKSRRRWEDNIKMDLMEIGIDVANWFRLAQYRVHCWAFVNNVTNLQVIKKGYFFTGRVNISFSNNILHHGVSK